MIKMIVGQEYWFKNATNIPEGSKSDTKWIMVQISFTADRVYSFKVSTRIGEIQHEYFVDYSSYAKMVKDFDNDFIEVI